MDQTTITVAVLDDPQKLEEEGFAFPVVTMESDATTMFLSPEQATDVGMARAWSGRGGG